MEKAVSRIRSADVRAVLAEGPATIREIALELDMAMRDSQVAIWVLRQSGQCRICGAVPNPEYNGQAGHQKTDKLHEITRKGRRKHELRFNPKDTK
jgi:hypothetical protein